MLVNRRTTTLVATLALVALVSPRSPLAQDDSVGGGDDPTAGEPAGEEIGETAADEGGDPTPPSGTGDEAADPEGSGTDAGGDVPVPPGAAAGDGGVEDLGITFTTANAPTPEELAILESLEEDFEIYVQAAEEYKRIIAGIIKVEYEKRKVLIEKKYGKQIAEEERLEDEARKSAIEYFEEFLRKYPDNPTYTPDAMFRLAELYYEQSYVDYDEAMQEYNEIELAFNEGLIDEKPPEPRRDFSKTIDLYVKLLERYPDYRNIDGVYYLLGYCYNEMGEFDAALYAWLGLVCGNEEPYTPGKGLEGWDSGEDEDVEDSHTSLSLASVDSAGIAATGSLYGAKPTDKYKGCEPVKADTRFYIETWLRIGEYHFDFDYSKDGLAYAISAYTKASQDEEASYYDLALYKLAWSYWRNGNYKEAIDQFVALVEYSDRKAAETGKSGSELRPEAIQYIALSFWESDWDGDMVDDDVDGLTRLEDGANIDQELPWLSEVYLQLGDTYLDDNQNRMAIQVYKAYLERPEWANALEAPEVIQKIIEAYDKEKDEENKIAMIAKLSEYGPGSDWAEENKDHPQTVMKVNDAAQDALLRTAYKHHETAQVYKQTGLGKEKPDEREEWLAASKEQYGLAAESYKRYLELYPNTADSYEVNYNLAEALFWSERFAEATEYYLSVRDSQLDNLYQKDAAFMLIKSYEMMMETDESLAVREEPPEVTEGPDGVKSVPSLPVPPIVESLISAQQTYLKLFPEDKKDAPAFAYLAAETNYNYGHWDQAKTQYEEIYDRYCKTNVIAIYSYQNLTFMASELEEIDESKRLALLQKDRQCKPEAAADLSEEELATLIGGVEGELEATLVAIEAQEIMDTYEKAKETGDPALFEQAAVGLEKLHDDNPEGEDAPALLWNAAISWEKCNKFQSALRVTEKLVETHPDSEFMGDALFKLGYNSFNSFEYKKSLGHFKVIADEPRFKDSPHRKSAVQNTALILENQQQYNEAAGYWKKFSSLATDKTESIEASWKAAMCYVKAKQWSKVESEMKSFAATYGKTKEASKKVVEARWYVAWSYKKRKKDKDFRKSLPAVIEAFGKVEDPEPADKATGYAAQAKFLLVEENLSELEKFDLNVNAKADKLAKEMTELKELRDTIIAQYVQVVGYASPEWAVAAQFRIGYCFEVHAKILLEAPIPKAIQKLPDDIRWEAEDQYMAAINEKVFPLEDAAQEEYGKALKISQAAGIMNSWTEMTLERLNAYDPDTYPLYKKGKTGGIDYHHAMPPLDLEAPSAASGEQE